MSNDVIISFFSSAIVACIPILFAALGEVLTERSGVMNLGLEGTMLMGAVAGYVAVVKTGSLWLGVGAALLAGLLMGLLFGYVTVEYSLVWSIALHMFNNLVLADLLARLTASWPEMALGTLNLVLFGGSALLSVVILSANRKRIRGYQKGEWMDRRCLKCFFLSPGILVMAAAMCVIMISMLFALSIKPI